MTETFDDNAFKIVLLVLLIYDILLLISYLYYAYIHSATSKQLSTKKTNSITISKSSSYSFHSLTKKDKNLKCIECFMTWIVPIYLLSILVYIIILFIIQDKTTPLFRSTSIVSWKNGSEFCSITGPAQVTSAGISCWLLQLFLYTRGLHLEYVKHHPSLKKLMFARIGLLFSVFSSIGSIAVGVTQRLVWDNNKQYCLNISNPYYMLTLVVLFIISWIGSLCLFLHSLLTHKRYIKDIEQSDYTKNSTATISTSEMKQILAHLIKRVSIISIIAQICILIIGILIVLGRTNFLRCLYIFLMSNLTILIYLHFKNWKEQLFPLYYYPPKLCLIGLKDHCNYYFNCKHSDLNRQSSDDGDDNIHIININKKINNNKNNNININHDHQILKNNDQFTLNIVNNSSNIDNKNEEEEEEQEEDEQVDDIDIDDNNLDHSQDQDKIVA